ncbi:MAG: polyphosphate kinase 1 [Lentisphaeria bacterium]|nr:polyphosphate kinase 1 [Lentisphaeria bacterium]
MSAPKSNYFNRELSWFSFNERVLAQALNPKQLTLEKLKFLSIVSSNFDEFFMVRVASTIRQIKEGDRIKCPSGLRPSQVLEQLQENIQELVRQQYLCLNEVIIPSLRENQFTFSALEDLNVEELSYLESYFQEKVFPVLTPLAASRRNPLVQTTQNLSLYLALKLRKKGSKKGNTDLAVVEIPADLDRFIFIPGRETRVLLLEDLILSHIEFLFSGFKVSDHVVFRLTRDADMSVDENRDEDFMEAMKEILLKRRNSFPVRLEVTKGAPTLRDELLESFNLPIESCFEVDGPVDLKPFMKLCFLPGLDTLRNDLWTPVQPQDYPDPEIDLWDSIKQKDIFLHHPYESFSIIENLVSLAANDPNVVSIKMTLYRTAGDSPIIGALARAAQNGKQVTVLVELKARFDEGQNIEWAEILEQAGVLVIYGVAQLKVHAKALLITRQEEDHLIRYAHFGTGNYNGSTAKLYTDMGLITTHEQMTFEMALFFNSITGYTTTPKLHHLAMAPNSMRPKFEQLIEREIDRAENGQEGLIIAKMNALVDEKIINLLYKASKAGVKVQLNIRGICCLRPGIKGVSENITVLSIIDRYLEHSRVYYFDNGGSPEVYLSSADWMPRNIDKRVELMFPIYEKKFLKRIRYYFEITFADNTNSYELLNDGTYKKRIPKRGQKKLNSQIYFHEEAVKKAQSAKVNKAKILHARRKESK